MSPDDVVYYMFMVTGSIAVLIWVGYLVRVIRRWRRKARGHRAFLGHTVRKNRAHDVGGTAK